MTISTLLDALLDKLPAKDRPKLRQRILAIISEAHSVEIDSITGPLISLKRVREGKRNGKV